VTTTTIAMTTTMYTLELGTSAPSLGCGPVSAQGFPTAVGARLRATGLSSGSLATIERDRAGLGLGARTDVRTADVRTAGVRTYAHDAQGLPPRVAPV
jgi:hypothetical protein